MAFKTWCVGTPGKPPRYFVEAHDGHLENDVMDGEVALYMANYPEAPHVISADGLTLLPDNSRLLLMQKKDRWDEARGFAVHAAGTVCKTQWGYVQCDPGSRSRINTFVGQAVAALVMGDASWSQLWMMQDNVQVLLDARDMISIGKTVSEHLDACHQNSQRIRAMIDAAEDKKTLDQIDIEDGYPQ